MLTDSILPVPQAAIARLKNELVDLRQRLHRIPNDKELCEPVRSLLTDRMGEAKLRSTERLPDKRIEKESIFSIQTAK